MNLAAVPAAPVHANAVSHAWAAHTLDADMLIRRAPAHDPLSAKASGQCACGGGCRNCAADSGLSLQPRIQANLVVGAVDDPQEREADADADQVIGATELSRKPIGAATSLEGGTTAPSAVHEALAEPGRPLDGPTRAFLEDGFGADFSHVRVHTSPKAAQSAAAVDALAYTVGSDIVLGAGEYAPATVRGLQLLAHEASHVVQQGTGVRRRRLQRFAASEVSKIAPTHADMLTQIRKLVDDASKNGTFNWEFFVEIAGGTSSTRKLDKALGSDDPTIKSRLLIRYLFTCRCGLIDMRHFLQMLYISQFATGISGSNSYGNRVATGKGREHELTAESESRFAPEDTTSNALGAATNLSMPGIPSPDSVFSHIKETLSRCDPIDWSSLSVASRQQVVDFYSALVADPKPRKLGDKIPEHQNDTAIPDILPVIECSPRERSFPFEVDPDNRKTIEGKNFLGGSKSLDDDDDIRAFVFTQRREVIRALPKSEKIRFERILRSWWISDDDLEALKILYNESTLDELRAY